MCGQEERREDAEDRPPAIVNDVAPKVDAPANSFSGREPALRIDRQRRRNLHRLMRICRRFHHAENVRLGQHAGEGVGHDFA
jgi:hypothetical protein